MCVWRGTAVTLAPTVLIMRDTKFSAGTRIVYYVRTNATRGSSRISLDPPLSSTPFLFDKHKFSFNDGNNVGYRSSVALRLISRVCA